MMQTLSREFEQIDDHRRSNAKYELADILRSAFAMFSLKSPSLLSLREQTRQEERNLKSIYRIEAIPSDTQMRSALDPISVVPLRNLLRKLFRILQQAGLVKEYHYWRDHVIVSVDGVEHFSSTQIHFDHCTTRTHRDGFISYHHSGLAALMLHPEHEEVFPLDFEPILKQLLPRKISSNLSLTHASASRDSRSLKT
jgi:hypothetical protein